MCIRSCDALLSMLLDLGKCKPCCSCSFDSAAFSTLVLAVASDCRAAASAAAAAARHACCVCSSFFFVIHNADASSTDIDFHASGRSPQTLRICSGAYVVADASTEQE